MLARFILNSKKGHFWFIWHLGVRRKVGLNYEMKF